MPVRVRNAILAQGLKLIVPSLVIGSAVAVALSHSISGLLYETEAIDPVTFGATVTLMLLVGLAGCYIPAKRATAINPVAAIRNSM
jgi:ABC-type antimicrobial peptide transport system permease subunit